MPVNSGDYRLTGIFVFFNQGPEKKIFSSREKIIFLGTLDFFLPDVFSIV